MLTTPVLLLIYNRLDTTTLVLEAIRAAKPAKLFIASDGPKSDNTQVVQSVREYVISKIDWPCEIHTLFREHNLGCKIAVSSAITWFFKHVDHGIILEDDCLPSQSFFQYCSDLLLRYKDDPSILMISGDGRATSSIGVQSDYAFTKYPNVWGWASWSRAWCQYDVDISSFADIDDYFYHNISSLRATRTYWRKAFDNIYNNRIDTWDYQLAYLALSRDMKTIVPKVNLVSNIGFGEFATHTHNAKSQNANIPRHDLEFPLEYKLNLDDELLINEFYDLNEFNHQNILTRILRRLKSLFLP